MHYVLHYNQITPYLPYFLGGALLSLELSVLAFCGGMVVGMAGALGRQGGGRVLSGLVRAYVVFFTRPLPGGAPGHDAERRRLPH